MSRSSHDAALLEFDRVYCMDALAGLARLPDESVDLVVTDPPYNIAAKNKLTILRGKLMSTHEAWGAWDSFHPFDYDIFIQQVLSACYRVLKPGSSLYMFTAREDSGFFIRKAVQRGFTFRNQLAMVRKSPLPSFAKSNWRSGFELCLYVTKGSKPATFNFLSQKECNNVYAYHSTFKRSKHPTEKPLEFIKKLIEVSSNPGELVLDPFMGSGTTAVAAKLAGRRFVGFENNSDYFEMCGQRLATEGSAVSEGHTKEEAAA